MITVAAYTITDHFAEWAARPRDFPDCEARLSLPPASDGSAASTVAELICTRPYEHDGPHVATGEVTMRTRDEEMHLRIICGFWDRGPA